MRADQSRGFVQFKTSCHTSQLWIDWSQIIQIPNTRPVILVEREKEAKGYKKSIHCVKVLLEVKIIAEM